MARTFDQSGAAQHVISTGQSGYTGSFISFTCWLKVTTLPATRAYAIGVADGGWAAGQLKQNVRIVTAGGAFKLGMRTGAGGDGAFETAETFTINAWHHLMVTYSKTSSANTPTGYVDGVGYAMPATAAPTGAIDKSGDRVAIGAGLNLDASESMTGELAEGAVFDHILTAGERDALYYDKIPAIELPGHLSYHPLTGASPEPELSQNQPAVVTGATTSDHPEQYLLSPWTYRRTGIYGMRRLAV